MDKEYLTLVLTAVFGAGGLVGVLGQLILARYSKSKAQRDVEIAKEYLSLAGITADELEKRINLIAKLDMDVRRLENENSLLQEELNGMKKSRKDRDEQMIQLEARVQSLQLQIDSDARERVDLQKKLAEFDLRYRVLWKYLIALLEQLKRHDIIPVPPPKDLESDPEIIKLMQDYGK